MTSYKSDKPLISIAMIGMGPSGFHYIHDRANGKRFDEVWAVNHAFAWYEDIDLVLAMDDLQRDRTIDQDYVERLEKSGLPVLASSNHLPNSVPYPLGRVKRCIWGDDPVIPLLENTITFALAYAIYRNIRHITMYGMDFCQSDRPEMLVRAYKAWQRRFPDTEIPDWFVYHDKDVCKHRRGLEPGLVSTAYMVGFARAKGIRIDVCPGSTFLDADRSLRIHGYQEEPWV